MSVTTRWVATSPDPAAPLIPQLRAQIQAELECPAAIAALLAARGITDPRRFLEPSLDDLLDPQTLLGMAAAVTRIEQAVHKGEKILIYGDYDVDGTVATVLLKTAIERIAPAHQPAQVSYHVPHRIREGYGMQTNVLGEAAAAGISLIISVDTGIRAFVAAAEARMLGLDLIVTDHHLPDGIAGIPDALAVINPAQPGCPYLNKHLCGAAVAFKLAQALLSNASHTPAQQVRLTKIVLPSFLKLVAIATIADSVPLTGENRAIAWLGLRALANPIQPGLRALMQVAKLPLDRPPTATEVGFRLAPRINAAGRMDVASDVVELFLTRDPALAQALAQKLDELNQDRRATEAAALEAIEMQLLTMTSPEGRYPPEVIVLSHPEWHRGVLGILASRVVDRTGRPALVMTEAEGDAHGSGRSVTGFHLLDALTAVHAIDAALFSRFGGHAHAVGFSLPASRLPILKDRLKLHSSVTLTEEMLAPQILYDLELSPSELTPDLCQWLERCAPFGNAAPEPVFLARNLVLAGPPRIIKERHICLPLESACGTPLSAMGWSRPGSLDWASRVAGLGLTAVSRIHAIFRLRENKHPQYGGLELDLVDLALAHPET